MRPVDPGPRQSQVLVSHRSAVVVLNDQLVIFHVDAALGPIVGVRRSRCFLFQRHHPIAVAILGWVVAAGWESRETRASTCGVVST